MAKKSTWSLACNQLTTRNLSAQNFKKTCNLDESTPESAIQSCNTGQRIPRFDSCKLTTTRMCNIRLQADYRFHDKVASVAFYISFSVLRTDGRSGRRTVT